MSEIIIKNVSKRFNKQLVLDNINMELTSGHIYGIAGINGSGKTVLMKCICGLIMPTMGSVHVDGKQIGKDIDFPDSIGALIETPGFIEYYNALDNMLSLASIKKITTKDEIIALLEKVGLDPNEYIIRYSGENVRRKWGKKESEKILVGNETKTWNCNGIIG